MPNITFITWNQNKADYLAKYLGFPVEHIKLDLDELQSLDLREIVEHKVKQAFEIIWKPVIVEDVSLEFEALGKLPGPFIRFFLDELPVEKICSLLDNKSRKATGRCMYGYYDGEQLAFFEGSLEGEIAKIPGRDNRYGRDRIFIANGYTVTRSELNEEDYQKVYLQIKPIEAVKEFLASLKFWILNL